MTRLPSGAKLYAEMALVRVCDPSLDGDMPSVLARISALEERLSQAPPPPAAEERRAQKPTPEKKVENPVSAGGEALSEKAQAAPEKREARSEPKSVRVWAEVIRKAEQKDLLNDAITCIAKGDTGYPAQGVQHDCRVQGNQAQSYESH